MRKKGLENKKIGETMGIMAEKRVQIKKKKKKLGRLLERKGLKTKKETKK